MESGHVEWWERNFRVKIQRTSYFKGIPKVQEFSKLLMCMVKKAVAGN